MAFERFDSAQRLYLGFDGLDRVRELRPAERNRPTVSQLPQAAAVEFVTEHATPLDVDPAWFTGEAVPTTPNSLVAPVTADGIELRYADEKPQFDASTVFFQQTWRGLEVWRSGLTVTVRSGPARVVGVANNTW